MWCVCVCVCVCKGLGVCVCRGLGVCVCVCVCGCGCRSSEGSLHFQETEVITSFEALLCSLSSLPSQMILKGYSHARF